jgi:large subunit ribosomal protein L19
MSEILRELEKASLRKHDVTFAPGDTLKVHVRIKEGDKERVQVFQGTVIGRRGSGVGETFTVRKISGGIGVERIFPLHSPNISKIERLKQGHVRRAKLYYLRELSGKSARITEKKRELVVEEALPEPQEAPVEATE